jgi:hypothetical protein
LDFFVGARGCNYFEAVALRELDDHPVFP